MRRSWQAGKPCSEAQDPRQEAEVQARIELRKVWVTLSDLGKGWEERANLSSGEKCGERGAGRDMSVKDRLSVVR